MCSVGKFKGPLVKRLLVGSGKSSSLKDEGLPAPGSNPSNKTGPQLNQSNLINQ